MINVLGARRVTILIGLVALNAILAAGLYMYVQPQKIKKERELRSINGQVQTLRRDVNNLQLEFDQLDAQRVEFQELRESGFFDQQGRRQAEIKLSAAQTRSGVIKAIASIARGTFEENELAEKANHKILKSPITIKIEALTDLDVFKYIQLVIQTLPGHVSIEAIDLRRDADISRTILRSIASGGNPPLVKADIQMVWRTMIPDESAEDEG